MFRSRAHWLAFVALLLLATLGCFLGGMRWMLRRVEQQVAGAVREADLPARALTLAETDAQAQAWLGRPLSAGALTLGAHGRTPQGARVDFSFPVRGPRGSGRLQVGALQSPEGWRLEEVVLESGGGTRVLLEAGPPPAVPPG